MTTSRYQLHRNCLAIARQLESDTESAETNFLDDTLSIEYTVDGQKKFLGAEILVAFGGPTIWVNTRTDTIEGSWGDTKVNMRYYDVNDLHSQCEDLFEATSGR